MGWLYLLAAGLAEIVFAAMIPRTDGFTRIWPTVVCLGFAAVSLYLLSTATRMIPIGTAYAIWVGIGTFGTAIYGILILNEDRSLPRILCFMLIVSGIVGLKLLDSYSTS
jgi:quaternary ammonium compound-resistance protein SugE